MKITPLDIRQKQFEKKTFGGIDKDEVSAFLNTLSLAWEKLLEENSLLKNKLEQAEREVQKLREVESSLYKTLKTAEDTSNTIIDQANKTAALTLKEAEIKADELLKTARWHAKNILEEAEEKTKSAYTELQQELKALEREFQNIEHLKSSFISEIKNMARDILEKIEKTESKSHKISTKMPPMPESSHEANKLKRELTESEKTADLPLFVNQADTKPQPETSETNSEKAKPLPLPLFDDQSAGELKTSEEKETVEKETVITSKKETNTESTEKTNADGGSFFDNL